MKKLITFLIAVLITGVLFSQTSNKARYVYNFAGGITVGGNYAANDWNAKIDSIKVISDKIYFYSGANVWSNDTLLGLYATASKLDLLNPAANIIIVNNTGTVKSTYTTFMGFRNGGDSISLAGEGAMLNVRQRLINANNAALGAQSVVSGYMSVSAGTNTIAGANDSFVAGNESVTGHRLYLSGILAKGNDGGGNYITINGNDISDVPGVGDESAYFYSAVDSGSYNWTSRVFWSYPIFWTNGATRDYPAGSAQRIGPVPLRCTGVSYDAGTGLTKVYYADSLLTIGASTWVTSCRAGVPGTGTFAVGTLTNSAGTGSAAFGHSTRAYGQGATAFGEGSQATANSSLSTGYYNTSSGLYAFSSGYKNISSGTGSFTAGSTNKATTNYSFVTGRDGSAQLHNDFVIGGVKFTNVGDAQIGLRVNKYTSTAVGWYALPIHQVSMQAGSLDYANKSVSGVTTVTAVQTTGTVGREGESGMWIIKWNMSCDDKYVADSANIADDKIFYTGKTLEVGDRLFYAAYTSTTMFTLATRMGGINYGSLYVSEVGDDAGAKWIKVALTSGGATRDITNAQAENKHIFYRGYIFATQELVGRSFVNDGDDIGNGTSTGIRAVYYNVDFHRLQLAVYGLANRTIRWVANTQLTVVGNN